MEDLETDTLYLAATRPPVLFGVPLTLFVLLLMLAGFIVVLMKNPLYLAVMGPLWLAARAVVSRDYKAVGVLFLYFRTAGRSVDNKRWGGASVTPFPIRVRKRGRGMADVG